MQTLRDKARELVSIAEGEILKKETALVALRRELSRVKKAMEAKTQQRAIRSEKCKGCIYKIAAMKALDEEEKVKAN
ncbi:hypothetical protein ES703_72169 [subsurface metagenome]